MNLLYIDKCLFLGMAMGASDDFDLAEFFGSNLTEQRAEMTYRRALTQRSKHLVLKIIDELNF